MTMSRGHVYIIGAGPGDPGLITVAGAAAIACADVVFYDALASPALLRHARPAAEVYYVGKRSGQHAVPQEGIEQLLVERAREGKTVARLKGGDPFVFGRGGEEALACREAGVPFTIVPGITSAIAAPAYAGIPVTHRRLATNFMVMTASEGGDAEESALDWNVAAGAGTLCILMGASSLAANMRHLADAGKDASTPVACVRWGTRPDQQVVRATLGTIAAEAERAGLTSPLVTVVGPVVDLAPALSWFQPGPLAGRRVVVTRARAQASELSQMLEALGAYVVEAPVIAVRLRAPNPELRAALLSAPDWLVLTSANGVHAVTGELQAAGLDARALAGCKLAAVGTATAEALSGFGLRPDFVPSRATGAELGKELPVTAGQRVLMTVSALTDDSLAAALEARGATVQQVTAYDNVIEELDEERRREVAEADAVTFTSASTARNLREALGHAKVAESAKLVSIGPQTSVAVREVFGRLDREAASPSLDALVQAVVEVLT
jgi:uroporphyrinogen III methyltransferase/synthase